VRPNATPVRRFALPLLLAIALASCGGGEKPTAQTPVEGLATLQVGTGDGAGARAWDGVVEAVREAALSAQTSGRVTEVLHDVNDRVAKGDVLVRLSAVEQQASVDAARAQLQLAEASYRRMANLAEGQYVSKMQLDQARAERDAARAQLASVGQQSAYTTIRAPYAGIVSARDVEPGESVGIGQRLMTVFAPEALRIEVSVPQSDAEAIRADPVATVRFDDGRSIEATAVTVFPAADAATHAIRVRVQLPPLDPVPQPGMTAKVAFPAVRGAAFPRIPASALVHRGEVNAVYVLADGRLSLRQLRLGERTGDHVDVIAGLRPGETIAADPVAAVQALAAARRGED
jgi:RND family efflux transporter, MFP subunit